MAATDALLAEALRRDPAGPLITFYDDATGDRAELSATTLNTWVAKTANLLQDELCLAPGERMAVLLPAHWQTAAVLLAGWAAGAVLTTDPAGAEVAFTDADRLPLAGAAAQVVALSLTPLGRPFTRPPAGALDYAVVVPGQGDHFTPYEPIGDDAPAFELNEHTYSGHAALSEAKAAAEWHRIPPQARILSTLPWSDFPSWRAGLLAPLAAGASLVLCAHPDPAALPARAAAERVTATMGVTLAEVAALGR